MNHREANREALKRFVDHASRQEDQRRRLESSKKDSTTYARKVMEAELKKMRAAAPGTLNNTLFDCAAHLGNFVGSGLLARGEVEDLLYAAAVDAGANNEKLDRDTIRRGIDRGIQTPRAPSGGSPAGRQSDQQTATAKPPSPPLDPGISCSDLMLLELPEPRYVVGNLLPEGVTILAARPKVGKSWLALQLAIGIAQGATVLGSLPTSIGSVLYLALEDTRRRLRKRVSKIIQATGWIAPTGLFFRTQSPRADAGGIDGINQWIAERLDARLVIVDTLARFRSVAKGRSDSYAEDYESIVGLKEIADRSGISILVIHHSRKADSESPFDQVSGTLGLTGAADAAFVITRSHDSSDAQLFIVGRDVEEETLTIRWDSQKAIWSLGDREGGIKKTRSGSTKAEACSQWLLNLLKDEPKKVIEIRSLAEADGYSAKVLYAARDLGKITEFEKGGRKWWQHPDTLPMEMRGAPSGRDPKIPD